MLSEPRTISLVAEFIYMPTTHSAEKLREVYSEVCRTCGYENFTRIQGGARIEARETDGAGFSQLNVMADRVQLIEDHTGISVEQFGKKIVEALSIVLSAINVPVLLVQQNKVRVTTTPSRYKTASDFLARSVFKFQSEQLEPLGRPNSVGGFRMAFPGTTQNPEAFNVRIESYVRDPRALYIENVGTFKTPIQHSTLQTVENNLNLTSDFIGDRVVHFLSQYDRREAE